MKVQPTADHGIRKSEGSPFLLLGSDPTNPAPSPPCWNVRPDPVQFAESAADPRQGLTLAPVYDMLPMAFAPAEGRLRTVAFEPRPPSAAQLDVWPEVAEAAEDYWARVEASNLIAAEIRTEAST